jgi:hypothetical protein
MPSRNRGLVEHGLPIKSGFRPYKRNARRFNPIIHDRDKEEVEHYSTQDSFDLVNMQSGFPTSYPLRRITPAKFGYV